MIKKSFVRLLTIVIVVMCGSSILKAQEIYYPILKLDINNRDVTAETEPNFVSFTLADSGSEVDGITVEFTAGSLDSRRRPAPTGIPFEQLYRDFVFSRPGGMTITLSGLVPNQEYEITIYAYDTGSAGNRIADWTANGDFIFTTSFNGGQQPTSAYSHAFWGLTTPDSTGTIVLECGPNPDTIEQSGANSPYGFVNALEIYSTIPVKIARRPRPAEGALLSGTTVNLSWLPGGYAVAHDVYLGDNFDDVNAATNSGPMGPGEIYKAHVDDANSYTVSDLIPGTTYYWRVDEVNNVYPDSPWKGDIWSFTISSKSAYQPIPVDTSLFVDPNVTLSWAAGTGAQSHHVYLGDNLEDVQAGTGGTDKGTVTEPNYSPPGLLEREKIYYWRVDEFDGVDTHTGDVWSFTTTLEGLGTVVFDIWEGIAGSDLNDLTTNGNYPDNPTRSEEITLFSIGTEEGGSYDDTYGGRIHGWLYVPITGDYTFFFTSADQGQLWLSTNDDPTNVQLLAAEPVWGWFNAFNRKSDPIPLIGGERYYIMAIWKEDADWDHCQAAWRGPGIPNMEIIQGSYLAPYRPVSAYGPNPEDGDTYINQTPMLYWNPGKYAASHNVYFGSDPNALNLIATTPAGQEKYGPLSPPLDVNQTYYWRIDEVNDLSPDGPWTGSVWSFTTADYIVVDDFEDYNDYAPDRIFDVWEDFVVNNTGMTVGHFDLPFAERTVIHYGSQAMYMRYDNDGTVNEGTIYEQSGTLYYSEAERQWDEAQDWTAKGATSLSLWFRGILASDGSFTEGPPITMTSRSRDIADEDDEMDDEFHFAYKRLSGEGSITARVVNITARTDDPNDNPAAGAQAGIMIRESLEPGAANVAMVVTFGSGINFQYRTTANAGTEVTTEAGITAPQWVRLTRSGNTFTGEYSANGNTWTTLGTPVDIPMLLDTYVGLCLASDNIGAVCAAEFSNVSTSTAVTGVWQSQDIGIESNIAEQLYVVLQDNTGNSAVVINPDAGATAIGDYTPWDIPFTEFTGVNMQAINKMSIGVGSRGSTQPGSAGDLYIDDIGLQLPDSEQ
jgi:hypothetical protein